MDSEIESDDQICAVCYQKYHHPTQLPCGHIFCFLCVKGIAIVNKKCAMCRTPIPADYLDNPVLLGSVTSEDVRSSEDLYQWYYEGRNGWWKYDARSNSELEAAYNAGDTECLLLLAGTTYRIDFESMVQVRRSDRTRRRKVRRDVPSLPAKGVAGIKQFETQHEENTELVSDVNFNNITEVIEIANDVIERPEVDQNEDNVGQNTGLPEPDEDIIDLTQSFRVINVQEEETGRDS